MPTTVPPRDGDATSAARGSTTFPDEAAFRKFFESTYSAAVADAQSKLGELPQLAPRVVEGAYGRLWQERSQISSNDAAQALLREEVSRGAGRAISRHQSSQRFGKGREPAGAGAANLEVSWEHVQRTVRGEAHAADAHREAAESARHGAAAGMTRVAEKRNWAATIGLGVLVVGILIGGYFWLQRASESNAVISSVTAPDAHPLQSTAGQIADATLGDGSKVHLAPLTRLMVAGGFPDQIRAVGLDGAAIFTVAPGQKLPFNVVAKKVVVTATGTVFAVSVSPEDGSVYVHVTEGSVALSGAGDTKQLGANQAVIVDDKGQSRKPTPDEMELIGGWEDNKFTVVNRPLKDALREVQRWYGDSMATPDPKILDRPVTIHAKLDSLMGAITQIEQTGHVKFEFIGKQKAFKDAGK